ncbi:MAG: DUF401 family protein [Candidatus Thermoplasmatota archaeon]|nr:DUF401 family protein [Candidatus Thermoplasmatota archaeon]
MLEIGGVVAGFGVLALLIYRRVDFGKAILIASAILLVFSEPSISAVYWIWEITREYETLRLIAIITQVGFLGYIYKDSKQVMRMIKELRSAFPDRRMVIASIPAIFGLMPMPGGALVSAPMIDDEGDRLKLDGVEKTYLNWWFRHIWFTVYPLSMGLILASSLSGISIYKIAMFNLPIFAVQIITGVIWGLKKIDVKESKESVINPLLLSYELLPIIVALSLNIVLGIPLYVTLFLAIIILLLQNQEKYSLKKIPRTFKDGFSIDLLMAAYGIMVFKGIIERTNAVAPVVEGLGNHIPILAVVLIASYLIGVLFGHLPGAVGVGFPVVLPLLPVINFQTASLVFIFIFLGYFTSPIHLCIILTIEYFEIDLKSFYRRMIVPFSLLVVAVVVWFLISGTFFLFF